ncbi:DUF3833 family protein, partial [Pseudomonas syringae group genomosp. 7]|uniref:DUF3833 family protein n=1 Tax=Pseudomonas syringae group genomosp. 7 TaxID=251699 RepID=UPI00376F5237
FTGRVEDWAMFHKLSGEDTKRYTVEIDGHSEAEVLDIHDAFSYSDGTKQDREWRLRHDGPRPWKGKEGDVDGEAYGQVAGNSFHSNYVL